jgi:hypothetical protein
MKLSVLIPCYNEQSAIEVWLKQFAGRGLNTWKLFSWNRGSIDGTTEVIKGNLTGVGRQDRAAGTRF